MARNRRLRRMLPPLTSINRNLKNRRDDQPHAWPWCLSPLYCAENSRVKAAYLIDPVDNVARVSPEGPLYPNAARALRAYGKSIGIAGASMLGNCNPAGSNWKVLHPPSPCPLWVHMLPWPMMVTAALRKAGFGIAPAIQVMGSSQACGSWTWARLSELCTVTFMFFCQGGRGLSGSKSYASRAKSSLRQCTSH